MQPVQCPEVPKYAEGLRQIEAFADVREILTSPNFETTGAEERTVFLGDTLITTNGQRHSELKQMLSPLMSRQAIASYELHLVEPVIRQVIIELRAKALNEGSARVDAIELIQAALTRIAAKVTGVDNVDNPERTETFRLLVMTLSEATTASFSKRPFQELIQQGRDAVDALVGGFLKPALDRRMELAQRHRDGEIELAELPRDLLMTLCLKEDVLRLEEPGTIPYVWRQCALFLTGSIKTTTHSLPHVFFHLDEWVCDHPDDREKRTDVEFLHQAVAESMRLHQSAPIRFRTAITDVTLGSGVEVAAGEVLALHTPRANMQQEVFGPDARYFNPYREIPTGTQPWGLTFGAGAHACLGRNLVIGVQNKGDEKHGTHGTAVRVLLSLFELGADLDPQEPPRRAVDTMHDNFETMPLVLRNV
jgi:cytochrome P450